MVDPETLENIDKSSCTRLNRQSNWCTIAGMEVLDEFADQMLVSPVELVERWAELEQQLALFALQVAHVDTAGGWADDGSVSMRAWMREHLRMSDADAIAWLRRAGLLNRFVAFAECALTGALSSSQLREIEKCATRKYRDLLHELQEDLAADVADLDAGQTRQACDLWRQRADALIDATEPAEEPARSLTTVVADDGSLVGRFVLDPAGRLEFQTAVSNALTFDGVDETRSMEQRRGDALFDIVAFFNLNHDGHGTPRHHPHMSLSLSADSVDRPEAVDDETGEIVDPGCVGTKLCDCIIHTILRAADGAPLAFGRARYTVPRPLFKQIAARDGGCRFGNCRRPVMWTEAHHITWWERHGPTDYQNLVLLCSKHHHMIHQLDLTLTWVDGWDLEVHWPDGRTVRSRPRGAPPTAPPSSPARTA